MYKSTYVTVIAVIAIGIIAFIGALLIRSCGPKDNELSMEIVETSNYIEVKPLQYKGHDYLWFRSTLRKGFGGVTHNPECKCQKK